MGQVLHGSAATAHAIRAAIQRSTASIAALSRKYGVNPKTVAKWRKRDGVRDARMGPKESRSTVPISKEDEALAVAFRRLTLLRLDDCLYALQASIPHLTRSSLHWLFQRHDISRLPDVGGSKPKKAFKTDPIGYFHIRCPAVVCPANHERGHRRSVDRGRQALHARRHRSHQQVRLRGTP